MGDMAEPWRSMREHRQKQVLEGKRVSMQYRTEEERQEGRDFKAKMAIDKDHWTIDKLKKLGLNPVRKGYSSFQINHNDRVGMYYNGKKGKQIHWKDGEVVKLPYFDSLEEYVSNINELHERKD